MTFGHVTLPPVNIRRFPMAYVIALPCIGTKDTACLAVCPVDCIHPTKDEPNFEAEPMLYIDPGTCITCHLCTNECPVKAIFPEEDVPAEWTDFIAKNAAYYQQNLDRYSALLTQLDNGIAQATQSVPAGQRKLLTYHDSWAYWARRYGWTVIVPVMLYVGGGWMLQWKA